MQSLQDALYNWLSIKVVCDARPDDTAAFETEEMFKGILHKEYQLSNIRYEKIENCYYVHFVQTDLQVTKKFPVELIECILTSINEQPDRFRNYE